MAEPRDSLERGADAAGTGERFSWIARGRVPCLDGLRAVSIGLVLLAHAMGTAGFPRIDLLRQVGHFGSLGVQVFFAISGFLITLLLLRERARTKTISLGGFYRRRILRIVPAYAVYLLAVWVLTLQGAAQVTGREWLAALTYRVNFLPGRSWEIGHVWSLSIEEHFYLAWPLLMLVLHRRAAVLALLAALAAAPLLRLGIYFLAKPYLPQVSEWTPTAIDSIAMGCLLAMVVTDPESRKRIEVGPRLAACLGFLAVGLLFGSLLLGYRVTLYAVFLGETLNALLIAMLIWLAASHAGSPVGRLLQCRPVVWIGVLSYSLYLWQQLFLNRHSEAWACRWPVNLLLVFGAAALSYYLIELPFLRLKERESARAPREAEGPAVDEPGANQRSAFQSG